MKKIRRLLNLFHIYLQLCKIKIALFTTLSSVTGFLLARPPLDKILPLSAGVFILASGASALNQFQERETDALMPRTSGRPVPSQRISPEFAFSFSLLLIAVGLTILFFGAGRIPGILGLGTVLWYNGVYTYLKKMSPLAIVPGAFTGAMPPAIGWAAGNASLADPLLIGIGTFFFIWQIPHFLLIIIRYGKEYENARLPSLTTLFSQKKLVRTAAIWTFAAGVISLLFPLLSREPTLPVYVLFCGVFLWFILTGIRILSFNFEYTVLFQRLNTAMIAVLILLSVMMSGKIPFR
jgi:heme o synthase